MRLQEHIIANFLFGCHEVFNGSCKDQPNLSSRPVNLAGGNEAKVSAQLQEKARVDIDTVLTELESRLDGLSQKDADSRLKQYGLNEIAREKRQGVMMRLLNNIKNPLVILLTALGVLSYLTGDLRAT